MSVKIEGMKELISLLENVPKKLDKRIPDLLIAEGKETEGVLKRPPTPIDTGKLRQSMNAAMIGPKTLVVKANATNLAPYAPYVEFGTRKMKAQPFFRPAINALRTRWVSNLRKLVNRTIQGK